MVNSKVMVRWLVMKVEVLVHLWVVLDMVVLWGRGPGGEPAEGQPGEQPRAHRVSWVKKSAWVFCIVNV